MQPVSVTLIGGPTAIVLSKCQFAGMPVLTGNPRICPARSSVLSRL
jgi:hypothetical protein